ncbi:phosphatase [Jiella marina]|uniref:phosphatase n=1 Tax=Jiella sp. LLJ827 TaxID=2917712 RepID=UPI0021016F50|nr:phosphatase [Jiella sp. LLJ827]MCQ0987984.1 phosphatase [Jiella sp. LLJ827]
MAIAFHVLNAPGQHQNGWPGRMLVCGQSEARRFHGELAPTHVLSIKTPGRNYLGPKDVAPENHWMFEFDDVDEPGLAGAPTAEEVDEIIARVATLPADAKLLIHGLQSVRRAPAVALGILATLVAPTDAAAALVPFCRHAPDPNRLVVDLFDSALGRDGALRAACDARFVASSSTLQRRSEADSSSFDFDMLAAADRQTAKG